MELSGKTAIVTGGGSGLGLAIAKTFVSEGALVCVCDRDKKLIKELKDTDPKIMGVVADVGVESDVNELFDSVLENLKANWMSWSITLALQVPTVPWKLQLSAIGRQRFESM